MWRGRGRSQEGWEIKEMHQHATGNESKGGNGDDNNHDSILMITMAKATTAIRAMADVITVRVMTLISINYTKTLITCITLLLMA